MSSKFRGLQGASAPVALAFALVSLGGCGAFGGDRNAEEKQKPPPATVAGAGKAVTVGDDQSGSPVELRADQQLIVRLRYAGTSQADWSLVDFQPGVLATTGRPRFEQDSVAAQYGEIAGSQSWRFEPMRPGQATLRFELRVPHSREPATAVATFPVTVR